MHEGLTEALVLAFLIGLSLTIVGGYSGMLWPYPEASRKLKHDSVIAQITGTLAELGYRASSMRAYVSPSSKINISMTFLSEFGTISICSHNNGLLIERNGIETVLSEEELEAIFGYNITGVDVENDCVISSEFNITVTVVGGEAELIIRPESG